MKVMRCPGKVRSTLVLSAILFGAGEAVCAEKEVVRISSLAELAEVAAQSGQTVAMKPGLYRMTDFIPLSAIPERQKREQWQSLTFSGDNNVFHLEGVTIEFDTEAREKLRAPMHTDEFLIRGGGNTLVGLTITNLGDGKALGGAVLGVTGRGNTLRDCTIHVSGSAPYGYGDLFGKGGHKHSGVHITGSGSRFLGCKVFTKAFGHAFYVQEDANDVFFENCYAEGVMRSTDEILAEKSGMAFERQFRSEMKNREGVAVVTPGYMKALSEDGFRTYGTHQNLVFRNCTAKNMRGGFELRTPTAPHLENCTAIGCERAFWISSGAQLVNCRGDAAYGPLLFAEGDHATVDLELLPAESGFQVHALAILFGTGNRVTIHPSPNTSRKSLVPILIGFGTPGMGDGAAPIPEREARDTILRNETMMPVILGEKARGGEVVTRGTLPENKGHGVAIRKE